MTPELLDGIDGELHASRLSDARLAGWARTKPVEPESEEVDDDDLG